MVMWILVSRRPLNLPTLYTNFVRTDQGIKKSMVTAVEAKGTFSKWPLHARDVLELEPLPLLGRKRPGSKGVRMYINLALTFASMSEESL